MIASDPDDVHAFNVADFDSLSRIVDDLTINLCNSVKGPGKVSSGFLPSELWARQFYPILFYSILFYSILLFIYLRQERREEGKK